MKENKRKETPMQARPIIKKDKVSSMETSAPAKKFPASSYQKAIFEWVKNCQPGSNLIVGAVPGSGKTTTLVEISKLLPTSKDSVFVAFNKAIATELGKKIPNIPCKTIHSLGYAALGVHLPKRINVKGNKYSEILESLYEDPTLYEITGELDRYLNLALLTMTDLDSHEDAVSLFEQYGFDDGNILNNIPLIRNAIKMGVSVAKKRGIINFTDMIWLPVHLNIALPKMDIVLTDETQDLNNLQLSFIQMMLKPTSNAIFVGDRNQAIYGFAGAQSNSMDVIKFVMNAEELPLSICYRCPESHVELAGNVYPGIEARPNAPKGLIKTITQDEIGKYIAEGDMLLSRVTAPLIKICFQLIAKKKRAKIVGRDISGQLVQLLRRVRKVSSDYEKFHSSLDKVVQVSASRMKHESSKQSLEDKAESLRVCYESWTEITSFAQFEEELNSLFNATDDKAPITLCTIHRAKGLEADNIFLLKDKLPLTYPKQQPWEMVQERNLQYVAYTRAKKSLYLVDK